MSESEVIQTRIDSYGKYGKRVTVNSVLCTKCNQWIHGRCSKLKKVTPNMVRFFVCSKCNKATHGEGEEQQELMCDEVKTVKGFCYLGNRLNASGGCEAAVMARTRVGWKKFREYYEILFGKRLSLWIKEKIYELCKIRYDIQGALKKYAEFYNFL